MTDTDPSHSGGHRPPDSGEVWCVVVAAGAGTRFGAAKQFARLAGSTVLDRSVRAAAEACDGVVVVLPPEVVGTAVAEVVGADAVVPGGATRTASSRAGVAAVPPTAGVILVHDAARPLASAELFVRIVDAVREGADAAVPVVRVTDTIRRVGGAVVDRDHLRAVQTPQGFPAGVLRRGLAAPVEASDDAGAVEALGCEVTMVEGEIHNSKITTPDDLVVAAALLSGRGPDTDRPTEEST